MRAAVLAAALLVLALPGAVPAPGASDGMAKADAPLLDALARGESPLVIALQGPALPAPSSEPASRAEWNAHWQRASAPFLDAMRGEVAALGGEVLGTTPAVNALHARVPAASVPALLARDDVRRSGLDWEGATRTFQGPGIQVNLGSTAAKVEAPELWALGYRGEGVKLAVIDTGIRGTHEMFKNADGTSRVMAWFDATSGNCATPCDLNGHGSHTASTAAGSNLFNNASPQGVAPRAQLMGVRIFIGASGTWQDTQEGLQAAFDLGAEVTSNSWGGTCGGDATITAELADALTEAGMISVFAAGNTGGAVICPAVVDNVISVGAVDIDDAVASFSSRGPCTWDSVSRICPDVMAVGVDVTAAWFNSDTAYSTISGTSMATPHVAGIVALLQQAKKATQGQGLSAPGKEADILLRYTAKDLGNPGPDNNYGWGLAKGKQAHDLLANPSAVNVRDIFAPPKATLRAYESADIALNVANLGGLTVSGPMELHIRQLDTGTCPPACETIDLSKSISLAKLREDGLTYRFNGAAHPAGLYEVTASFPYTASDGTQGTIDRSATFLLKKVSWAKQRAVPGEVHAGDVLFSGVVLRNTGNEDASNVRFTENWDPASLAPLPVAPPGAGTYGALANPGATTFTIILATKRAEEYWNIGPVGAGSAWTMSYNFLAAKPGAYAFTAALTYQDETGRAFSEAFNQAFAVSASP